METTGENAAAPITISEKAGGGTNYVIAIGIDKYARPKLNLDTCENDCRGLTSLLVSQYQFRLYGDILLNDQATRQNIQTLFRNFRKSGLNPDDNLIIYYSGHGYLFPIERSATGEVREGIGCWVTYETMDLELNSLYKTSELIDEVRQLKLRHVVIISDCCNATGILEVPTFYNFNANVDPSLKSIEDAQSRWAICSSRSNQTSNAGKAGECSKFTKELIRQLELNKESKLYLTGLIGEIKKNFDNENWQRPFAGPLNIIPNNGGEFIFRPKDDYVIIKKREALLKSKLNTLNYTAQYPLVDELAEKGRLQFAIFSGRPTCGLSLLAYRARRQYRDEPFRFPVSHDQFKGNDDARLIAGLKAAFKLPSAIVTLEDIKQEIVSRLDNTSVVLEVSFYHEPDSETDTMPAQHKKDLLDSLAKFALSVNSAIPGDKHFLIFVMDYELCDYETLYENKGIQGIDTTFIPKTTPIELDILKRWYKNMEREQDDPDDKSKLNEFRTLFTAVCEKFPAILETTKGYPGSVLRQICEEAKCKTLADKFLNPDKN
jgi:hypothetical protein